MYIEHFREYFYDLFISFTYNYSTYYYKYTIYDSCLHNIIIIISLYRKHRGSVIFLFINNIIQRNDNSSFYKHAAPSWRAPVV